jgi:hypothetical protein
MNYFDIHMVTSWPQKYPVPPAQLGNPKSRNHDNQLLCGVFLEYAQWGLGIFLFTTVSRPVLAPTQPPI